MVDIFPDICSAIESLSPENRYAFVEADFLKSFETLDTGIFMDNRLSRDAISFVDQNMTKIAESSPYSEHLNECSMVDSYASIVDDLECFTTRLLSRTFMTDFISKFS